MRVSSQSEPSVPFFSFSSLNAILGHQRRAECSISALETRLEHQPALKPEQTFFLALTLQNYSHKTQQVMSCVAVRHINLNPMT